jgi:hypothetical protein
MAVSLPRAGSYNPGMTTNRTLASLVLSVALAAPSAAAAASQPPVTTIAPPGNSAIDEYKETVPGPGGDQSEPPGGTGHHGALTPDQQRALNKLGPDGRALASVVDATAPRSAHSSRAPSSTGSGLGSAPATAATAGAVGARSTVSATLAAAVGHDGGGGMGLLLPLLLAAGLLGVIVRGAARRWRRTP